MKGIILAGGSGTRLYPLTVATSKQLLPVYDKPLIYYPLSVLMLADVREILIISTPQSVPHIRNLLGDGHQLGLELSYAVQDQPRGIADAYRIGADHVAGRPSALVLGDNVFHGTGFGPLLRESFASVDGVTMFGYPVSDPERYGIGEIDATGRLVSLVEKPRRPQSNNAITGLYLYDADVVEIAAGLRPSHRGELEITDVNRTYVEQGRARLVPLGRGFTWLDAGTPASLLEASQYVQMMENRQGVRVACVEEIALRRGFIDAEQCRRLGACHDNSDYSRYVMDVATALADDVPVPSRPVHPLAGWLPEEALIVR